MVASRSPHQVHLGTEYGGYWVDVRDLNASSVVYSFGIGEDLSFDLALTAQTGARVLAYDPTPRSIAWAKGQNLPETIVVHELALSNHDGTLVLYPPRDPLHISHSIDNQGSSGAPITVKARRLRTLLTENGHDHIDVLKMDIEGAEYGVLDDIVRDRIPCRQILVEFHHRTRGRDLLRTQRALWRLLRTGYRVLAVSESGHEVSLLHVA